MKIRVINILEIVFGIIFILSFFITKTGILDLGWVAFLLTMLLGMMYLPLGFYTLKSPNFNIIYSILFGVLFSVSLAAIMLSLMKQDISIILIILMLVIFLMAAGIQAFIFYFLDNKQEGQIIMYNKGITIRYLIFFIFMVYVLVTYKFLNLK